MGGVVERQVSEPATYKVRTVGDLKKALVNFPDDMLVSTDGEVSAGRAVVQRCSVYPPIRRAGKHTAISEGGKLPCETVCFVGQPDE